MEDVAPDTWEAILDGAADFEDDDGMSFDVIRQGRVSPALPLVIWIHPGDACESDCGNADVMRESLNLQSGMGLELQQFGPCDVVVLHRYSSQFAFEAPDRVSPDYFQAMTQCMANQKTTMLFGDDLEACAAWLIENVSPHGRPDVLLTGAWSHPEYGCVAAVGQALHAAGVERLRVSHSSPSDPGDASNVWQPPSPTASRTAKPR